MALNGNVAGPGAARPADGSTCGDDEGVLAATECERAGSAPRPPLVPDESITSVCYSVRARRRPESYAETGLTPSLKTSRARSLRGVACPGRRPTWEKLETRSKTQASPALLEDSVAFWPETTLQGQQTYIQHGYDFVLLSYA